MFSTRFLVSGRGYIASNSSIEEAGRVTTAETIVVDEH
jgi:hypothetical protein